jgi:transposase
LACKDESDSVVCMPKPKITDIENYDEVDVARMSREELEAWARQGWELARRLANQVGQDSRNSSRPPSSDDPWRRDKPESSAGGGEPLGPGQNEAAANKTSASGNEGRRPGKQPGAPGRWRNQPLVTNEPDVEHHPSACGCGACSGVAEKTRQISAHFVCDLERGDKGLRITIAKHCYFAIAWSCGHETTAQPGEGLRSDIEGRRRNLQMSERCLVGPALAAFIAALSLRCRLSRAKIQEFLADWLGLELGTATIERCIHEFGLASEPVVEDLLKEIQTATIANLDETPWYEKGALRWLWVVVTSTAVVFRIGSRRKEELAALIGDAFLGWLITDGYAAYRHHERRQRCLAHLIRKAVALAEGYYGAGASFGGDLARDLRRLIEKVAEGGQSDDAAASIKRLVARIKWNCQCNRYEVDEKVRELAREILNDWDAVIAFVSDPTLPPPPTTMQSAPCAMPSLPAASASGRGPAKAVASTPRPSASSRPAVSGASIPGRMLAISSPPPARPPRRPKSLPPSSPHERGDVKGY